MEFLLVSNAKTQTAVDGENVARTGDAAFHVPHDAPGCMADRAGLHHARTLAAGADYGITTNPQKSGVTMKRGWRWTILVSFLVVAAFLPSRRALAQVDSWEFEVYPYTTLS